MPSILPPTSPAQDDVADWLVYPFEGSFWRRDDVRELGPRVVYIGPLPQYPATTKQIVDLGGHAGYVYVIQDREGDVLYVGKTINPVGRLANHRAKKHWWPKTGLLTLLGVDAPDQASAHRFALRVEAVAIRDLEPRYNIAGVR